MKEDDEEEEEDDEEKKDDDEDETEEEVEEEEEEEEEGCTANTLQKKKGNTLPESTAYVPVSDFIINVNNIAARHACTLNFEFHEVS